jgi:hypothetical protein
MTDSPTGRASCASAVISSAWHPAQDEAAPGSQGQGRVGVSQHCHGGNGAAEILPRPPHFGQRTKPLSGPWHCGQRPMTTQESLRFSPVPWH